MPTREKYQEYLAYYQEYNRKRKEYRKQYYIDNKKRLSTQKKKHYWENRDMMKQKAAKYYKENYIILKQKGRRYYYSWKNYNKYIALFHYSNGSMCCLNCGENIFELLTIDHIEGEGGKHRKDIGYRNIHVWLRKNKFPEGYQILCYNCNLVKARVTSERYHEIIKELQSRQLFMGIPIREVV